MAAIERVVAGIAEQTVVIVAARYLVSAIVAQQRVVTRAALQTLGLARPV